MNKTLSFVIGLSITTVLVSLSPRLSFAQAPTCTYAITSQVQDNNDPDLGLNLTGTPYEARVTIQIDSSVPIDNVSVGSGMGYLPDPALVFKANDAVPAPYTYSSGAQGVTGLSWHGNNANSQTVSFTYVYYSPNWLDYISRLWSQNTTDIMVWAGTSSPTPCTPTYPLPSQTPLPAPPHPSVCSYSEKFNLTATGSGYNWLRKIYLTNGALGDGAWIHARLPSAAAPLDSSWSPDFTSNEFGRCPDSPDGILCQNWRWLGHPDWSNTSQEINVYFDISPWAFDTPRIYEHTTDGHWNLCTLTDIEYGDPQPTPTPTATLTPTPTPTPLPPTPLPPTPPSTETIYFLSDQSDLVYGHQYVFDFSAGDFSVLPEDQYDSYLTMTMMKDGVAAFDLGRMYFSGFASGVNVYTANATDGPINQYRITYYCTHGCLTVGGLGLRDVTVPPTPTPLPTPAPLPAGVCTYRILSDTHENGIGPSLGYGLGGEAYTGNLSLAVTDTSGLNRVLFSADQSGNPAVVWSNQFQYPAGWEDQCNSGGARSCASHFAQNRTSISSGESVFDLKYAFYDPIAWEFRDHLYSENASKLQITANEGDPCSLFVPGNTQAGNEVGVSLPGGTTVTFANVTTAGETTISSSSTEPLPPSGYSVGSTPTYYDVTTTATYSGGVDICFGYDAADFIDPSLASLLHYQSGNWTDVTTSNDIVNHIICGHTDGLSPFVVATRLFGFVGFNSPVDNQPVINKAKSGQAIPIKWSLMDRNGNRVSDLSALVSYGYSAPTACSGSTADIEEYSSAGESSFRYDSASGQFLLTSKTNSAWAGSCRILTLRLSDGSTHSATFQFSK